MTQTEPPPSDTPLPPDLDTNVAEWEHLTALIDAGEAEAVVTFLRLLPPEDTPYTVTHLDDERRSQMLAMLADADADFAADLLEHFADEHAADMIEVLEPPVAAAILDEMDSDEQTDVLAEMATTDQEAILDKMVPEEADDARARLRYAEDTAGGLMITEYLRFPDHADVDDAIRDLRAHADEHREYEIRNLYLVDGEDRFVGVVPMRYLLPAPAGTRLVDLRIHEPVTVSVDAELEALEDLFDRHDFYAAPVLDGEDHLIGVVQRSKVEEAMGEQAEEALAKFGGIIAGEELRSMPLMSRAVRRLAFLLPILVLLMVSATIIALFEDTVQKVPILAAFLPVVAGLCGSGGNQAVAVSMREISLGLIDFRDFTKVMLKEAQVALFNGLILGTALAVVVWVWQDNAYLALAVGGAVPIVILIAKCVGGTVPVLFRGAGIDPAMASGPTVTTVVDLCSFFTVLLLAQLMITKLVGV